MQSFSQIKHQRLFNISRHKVSWSACTCKTSHSEIPAIPVNGNSCEISSSSMAIISAVQKPLGTQQRTGASQSWDRWGRHHPRLVMSSLWSIPSALCLSGTAEYSRRRTHTPVCDIRLLSLRFDGCLSQTGLLPFSLAAKWRPRQPCVLERGAPLWPGGPATPAHSSLQTKQIACMCCKYTGVCLVAIKQGTNKRICASGAHAEKTHTVEDTVNTFRLLFLCKFKCNGFYSTTAEIKNALQRVFIASERWIRQLFTAGLKQEVLQK